MRILLLILGFHIVLIAPLENSASIVLWPSVSRSETSPQAGNTISGYVFGMGRQALADISVELLDDFSRSLGRTRTNSSGRYTFMRVPSGRFRVRILPFGTDYVEQEQEVEIRNIMREIGGTMTATAVENVQKDFYLQVRKAGGPAKPAVVFAENVPTEAKTLYANGLELLRQGKESEGLRSIRKSIETFPDYYEAVEKLASEYVRLKHFEAAEILFLKGVQLRPRIFPAWYGLSYARYQQNKNAPAIDAVDKSLEINQSSAVAYLLSGVLARRVGNFSKSESQLKKAKGLSKVVVPEIHWQLALLYSNNLNRYKEAAD